MHIWLVSYVSSPSCCSPTVTVFIQLLKRGVDMHTCPSCMRAMDEQVRLCWRLSAPCGFNWYCFQSVVSWPCSLMGSKGRTMSCRFGWTMSCHFGWSFSPLASLSHIPTVRDSRNMPPVRATLTFDYTNAYKNLCLCPSLWTHVPVEYVGFYRWTRMIACFYRWILMVADNENLHASTARPNGRQEKHRTGSGSKG